MSVREEVEGGGGKVVDEDVIALGLGVTEGEGGTFFELGENFGNEVGGGVVRAVGVEEAGDEKTGGEVGGGDTTGCFGGKFGAAVDSGGA